MYLNIFYVVRNMLWLRPSRPLLFESKYWRFNPRGVLPLKRVTVCEAVKTPFSCSLSRSTRPPFSTFFISTRPYFNQKSDNISQFFVQNAYFWQICSFYSKNQSKFSSGSLNLGQKSVLKAAFCPKISSTSPQLWCQSILQAPIVALR